MKKAFDRHFVLYFLSISLGTCIISIILALVAYWTKPQQYPALLATCIKDLYRTCIFKLFISKLESSLSTTAVFTFYTEAKLLQGNAEVLPGNKVLRVNTKKMKEKK